MARTQRSLKKNLSSLTTTPTKPKRKTRSDKKPEFITTKSDLKWQLGNGNGTIKSMPWYLHPVKKNTFNKSWCRDYDDACKQIARLKLTPEDYTLWHLKLKEKSKETK